MPDQKALRFRGGMDVRPPSPKKAKKKKMVRFAPHMFGPEVEEAVANYFRAHIALEMKTVYSFLSTLDKWNVSRAHVLTALRAEVESSRKPHMAGLSAILDNIIHIIQNRGAHG